MRELPIALTFDLDPDFFDESVGPTEGRTKITWRGISEGIGLVREQLARLAIPAAPSWFVRVDNQIADLYGRPAHLLETYRLVFKDLSDASEELAWHPHLYRREGEAWRQETDGAALFDSMAAALEDYRIFQNDPGVVRIGEAYGSNALMGACDALGLKFDSTAMPGRKRIDGERMLDWEPTPADAYRPSLADYRVPGAPAHSVIEIPFSMLKVKAAYDDQPYLRYLDLSFRTEAMAAGIDDLVRDAAYIVTVTHPSGIIPDFEPPGGHGLVAFDPKAIAANMKMLLDAAERAERPVRFVSISDLGAELKARLDER